MLNMVKKRVGAYETASLLKCRTGLSEGDEVLLKVHGVFFTGKVFNLVRVNVVAAERIVAVVAGQIILVISALVLPESGIGLSEDACPLSVGKLTTLCLADACVAEVRAFEDMTIGTADALVAVAVEAKRLADRSTWRQNTVSIRTFTCPAIALGIMHTMWCALGNQVMRQVTLRAGRTSPFLKKLLARGDFRWIVDVTAHGTFWTRAYTRLTWSVTIVRGLRRRHRTVSAEKPFWGEGNKGVPVLEKFLQVTLVFLTAVDCLGVSQSADVFSQEGRHTDGP